ncbi:MAG TPA: lysyl oxidase family protein [Jiangellales bacterium]|nr:lysyl oxidase family protein [Jiangellales bacterium]
MTNSWRTILVSAAAVCAATVVTATVVAGVDSDGEPVGARAVAVADWPEPSSVPVGARLLPNLTSPPAEEISLQVVEGVRELRFAGILANPGVAPIEVVPETGPLCPEGQRHVSQVFVHDTDGDGVYTRDVDTETSTRPLGCMLFHPEHDHWHVDSSARYALTRPGDDDPIVSQDKVSFCLRDNRPTGTAPAEPAIYYGECERDTRQGISAGWADVYQARLPSQKLDLPADLPDGTYCLHTEADPYDLVLESDETDNASVLDVVVAAGTAAPAPTRLCT